MTSTVLSGGRRRSRAGSPLQTTLLLLVAAIALLAALFVLWIVISLGADLIGDWMLLPIALSVGLLMRRRMRDVR